MDYILILICIVVLAFIALLTFIVVIQYRNNYEHYDNMIDASKSVREKARITSSNFKDKRYDK